MKTKLNTILISLLLFLGLLISYFNSQSQNDYSFLNFSTESGLTHPRILSTEFDHDGFLWIGTYHGLNVFDGHEFRHYQANPDDSLALSTDEIRALYSDSKNNIWIGTNDGVLHKYSRELDAFLRFNLAEKHIERKIIKKIEEDKFGNLWIAYLDCLVRFNYETGESKKFLNPNFPGTSGTLEDFFIDDFGRFWVGYWNAGVYVFNPTTGEYTQFFTKENYPELTKASVMNIKEDERHNLWLGSFNMGLIKIEYPSQKVHNYQHIATDKFSLNTNKIKTLEVADEENIWIGTEEGGLDLFRVSEEKFYHYFSDFQSKTAPEGYSIYTLELSNEGQMWVGTRENGLFLTNTTPSPFQYIGSIKNNDDGNILVTSVCEETNGTLWAAIKGDIAKVDIDNSELVPLNLNLAEMPNVIKSAPNGNLWIGGLRGSIYVYNPNNKQLKKLFFEELNDVKITDFIFKGNNTYVACNVLGKINFQAQTFEYINTDFRTPYAFIDDQHELYLFGRGTVIPAEYSEKEEFKVKQSIPYSFPNSKCGLNTDSYIYNGTDAGLYQIEKSSNSVVPLDKLPGDINYEVNSVFSDRIGRIWFSTAYNVVSFDEVEQNFRIYGSYNGVPEIRFRDNVGTQLKNGNIVFGGENGLVIFSPDLIEGKENIPNLAFTKFAIGNKQNTENLILEPFLNGKQIVLNHNQNFFTITYSLIHFEQPENVLYQFRLDGFDKEWNEGFNLREKTYMNLPYGEYTFMVKAKNPDHQWSETKSLQIKVRPPFWLRWYAYVFYFAVLIALLFLFYRYSIKQEKLNSQLNVQKLKIESVEQMAQKEQELNDLKIRFFTNISHEFKTPLTLIISPLEQYIETTKPLSKEILSQIHSNAVRLRQLITQILDIRKIDANQLKINYSYADIIRFTTTISSHFKTLANNKKLSFELITHEEKLFTRFDADKMEKVLFNLLSNAIKYTQSGRIKLEVGKYSDRESGTDWIELVVKDTGQGISKKNINKIFDRFFQVKQSDGYTQGTGIGLALAKDMVQLHEGTIDVDSEEGEGTKFTVHIPYLPEISEGMQIEGEETSTPDGLENEEIRDSGKKIILITEDNPEMRNYIAGELKNEYEVIEAEDGKEGLEKCLRYNPDLIISDIMMPGTDGLEFCKQLKSDERTSHIPMLLVTALSSAEHQQEGYQSGADDYITKPFNITILKEKIKNFITTREQLRKQFVRDAYSEPEILKIASNDEKFLQKCYELIEENLSNSEFEIDDFAKEMATSRSQLYRKLKALTGLSASEFIKITRLKISAKLIKEKNYNISEAAYMVGFKDPKYFSKCFQKQFGVIPSKYKI